MKMNRFTTSLLLLGLAAVSIGSACEDTEEILNPFIIEDTDIIPADTTLEVGDNVSLEVDVHYRTGLGQPNEVNWSLSDSQVVELTVFAVDQVQVDALAVGSTWVIGLINEEVRDSARIQVVEATEDGLN